MARKRRGKSRKLRRRAQRRAERRERVEAERDVGIRLLERIRREARQRRVGERRSPPR